ncbi:MAG: tetratricopeptide repeat protein [Bacteroidota bacterium]
MKKLLLILVLLLLGKAYAQSKIDSLEQKLLVEKEDTNKVNILLTLADHYRFENPQKAKERVIEALDMATGIDNKKFKVSGLIHQADLFTDQAKYDSALTVFQEALILSEKIQFHDGKSAALIGLGNTHTRQGNLDKGEEYLLRNIDFAEEIGDDEGVASCYNNLGNIYNEQGEYTKAMEGYTKAAQINTRIGLERNAAINMANMGMIYHKLENFEDALVYFRRSDSIFTKLDFQMGRVFVMKNMGIILRNQGKPEEALILYQKVLVSYDKLGQRREMLQTYVNIGNIYSDRYQSGRAIENFREALSIATSINDSISMAMVNQSIGQEYFYASKLDSSLLYSGRAVDIGQAIDADLTVVDGYKTLSEVNSAKGNHKLAYDLRIKYDAYKDSLYTIEKRDLAEEIEAKYQNEQKTKEIALLASEKEVQSLQLGKRKNERNAFIVLAILVLLLAVLLYNQYRIKQQSNKELKELNRLKSDFFANISHEFRTPLTLIQGPIERLDQHPEEELKKDELKMIRRNTNKVLSLVNQLLLLSQIDEGKLEIDAKKGDLYKCLRTAAASFHSYAVQRDIDYKIDIPDEPLWAVFDQDKLEKVIYNILSNAFKFSDDGEQVSLVALHTDGELSIQVSDSGRGIAGDKLSFVFDRFYQVDSSSTRDREGSGIGLSLSKELVEQMKGSINVSSVEGKGSQFSIHIPLQKVKAPHPTVEKIPSGIVPKLQRSEPFEFPKADTRELPNVLVIEDNEDMRQYIKQQLLQEYKVIEASDGEQGLKTAISNMPDLIILDVMMPRMDGMEVCEKLRTNLSTSHIPIIMLTARAGEENKIKGLENGADEYLTKPFSSKELSVRVQNLLTQRKRLQQYYLENQHSVDPQKITTTSLDKKFLEQVLLLLETHYADPNFGVPNMQMELGMSKTQLNRKLKAKITEDVSWRLLG